MSAFSHCSFVGTDSSCPFSDLEETEIVYNGTFVVGFWDRFPVNPGHVLLIPKSHIVSWLKVSEDAQVEFLVALSACKNVVETLRKPDGFTVGINIGSAAGQTVPHVHVHLIPRYTGDVVDPRGGVRGVIPSQKMY